MSKTVKVNIEVDVTYREYNKEEIVEMVKRGARNVFPNNKRYFHVITAKIDGDLEHILKREKTDE